MPRGSPELDVNRPVEREAELDQLQLVLEAARRGRGRLVVVEGERGLGKTRLLEAAAEQAQRAGLRVLRARGVDLERGFAFGVALQLFEGVLADARAEGQAELLSGAARLAALLLTGEPGATPDADENTHPIVHGLYWLTGNVAWASGEDHEQGLTLLVDDADAADRPSIRYLAY